MAAAAAVEIQGFDSFIDEILLYFLHRTLYTTVVIYFIRNTICETIIASQAFNKNKKTHRVDAEDPTLGLDVWQRELNLAVDSTGPDKRGVERFDLVRRHDHL